MENKEKLEQYKWDLSKFCKNPNECKTNFEKLLLKMDDLQKYTGKLGNPDEFLEFLEKQTILENEFWTYYIYAKASHDVETDNQELQSLADYIMLKRMDVSQKLAHFEIEIKDLGNDYLKKLKQNPKFSEWQMFLDNQIRQNEHTLTEVEEQLITELAKLQEGFKNINSSCYFADICYPDAHNEKGENITLNPGNITGYLQSSDRILRKSVSESVTTAYKNYANLMTQNFANYVSSVATISQLRKYPSVLDRQLDYYYLDTKVYDNIIKFSNKYSKTIETTYYKTKKAVLGYETLYNYDLNAPILNKTKKYTVDEAYEIIKNAMSVLGPDYVALIEKAQKERWVDFYPQKNKRSGGYTWGSYGITNIIMMNFNDDLDSVYTLAHELGHAINHYTIDHNQKIQNIEQPIFMAEIASTFNENLLTNYLLKQAKNKDEEFEILTHYVREIIGTVFRQATFSEFEDFCYKTVEKGEQLSLNMLEDKWFTLSTRNLKDIVDYSNYNKLGWQNIWHFYNMSYYVWQYALAFLGSSYFANTVINNEPKAVETYLKFLTGPGQKKPADFLLELGVDLNNDEFYIKSFENFEKITKNFEIIANKYKK